MALGWVQPKDEAEVRAALARSLAVRKLGSEAKELADYSFLETLVRLHRAGEGAPYTGLQPAGRDLGPASPAADQAAAGGRVEPLLGLLTGRVESGVRQRLEEVLHTRDFEKSDLGAARAHVKAYVEFVHYVEGIYAASTGPGGHTGESHR